LHFIFVPYFAIIIISVKTTAFFCSQFARVLGVDDKDLDYFCKSGMKKQFKNDTIGEK